MASQKQSTKITIILFLIAGVTWYLKNNSSALEGWTEESISINTADRADLSVKGLTEASVTTDEFTVLKNCQLIDHRNNDGDSFHVRHSKGKNEVRLYFVDTAESRLHKFNGDRIADQGKYFGGLSQEQTIDVGVRGKKFTLSLLKAKPFTIITKWEMDLSGKRPYVYALVEKDSKQYYLHEILAKSGLVRTKTRGASLPDGKTFYKQRDLVRALEKEAKKAKRGAWGVNL